MLPLRFIDRVKFVVERQFVKGAGFQLLVVAVFIGLISVVGGLLVMPLGAPFDDVGSAVWWAFLRLTDPGYLGDDEGNWRRFVSTILTVSGYVVFLGALVAIMTRWLIARMNSLERGLTPVALRNHIVVLGWTNQTVPLLSELLTSQGRVRRFLERHHAQRLRLVVLSEEVSATQVMELRDEPGIGRKVRQIILRSGLPIQSDALHRVACLEAAAVIVPSSSQAPGSLVTPDIETVKALLSINAQARQAGSPLPYVVAEIQDLRKTPVIERAYPGDVEVIAGDATISRLMAQNILHPGLSDVYNDLLTVAGREIFVRSGEPMAGMTLEDVAARLPAAIVLGLMRPSDTGKGWELNLLASSRSEIGVDDRVVMIASEYADTEIDRKSGPMPVVSRPAPVRPHRAPREASHRVLILGWNRRVPSLMAELASYSSHRFDIDLVSVVSAAARESDIRSYNGDLDRVRCHHVEADYMVEGELRRLRPDIYDSVLLLSSDRLASDEEADARTLVGYLQLEEIVGEPGKRPQLIMELSDPHNQSLLSTNQSELIVSPMILSHVLAQVALRRELGVIFEELFTVGGAEIQFRNPGDYALPASVSFRFVEKTLAEQGEIALGVLRQEPDGQGRRLVLNPPREGYLDLRDNDRLVVLCHSASGID
jgi:hypothetical protein